MDILAQVQNFERVFLKHIPLSFIQDRVSTGNHFDCYSHDDLVQEHKQYNCDVFDGDNRSCSGGITQCQDNIWEQVLKPFKGQKHLRKVKKQHPMSNCDDDFPVCLETL